MKIKSLLFTALLAIPVIASAQPTYDKAPTEKTAPEPDKSADANKPADKTGDKTKSTAKLSDEEKQIVAHLHHVNVMEIGMGKLAKQKATAAVKRFGDMLIKEHSTADKELKTFAKKNGLAKIPMHKPQTEAEKQEAKQMKDSMAALKKLKGADFDREFLRLNVEGHEKELAKTDVFLASATNEELKTLLEGRKTTLRRHADAAKELQAGNAQASAIPQPQPQPKSTK